MERTQEQVRPRGRGRSMPSSMLRFEGATKAPAEAVYDVLADLQSHLDWAGDRQGETTRLLTMRAPEGPATVGTEFLTTGSDGKVARWSDRSVVTEATRPEVFEFVTEGVREAKPGSRPWHITAVNRYEIATRGEGCTVTFTQELTRFEGAPWLMSAPGVRQLVKRLSSKYMRRGFDGLLALAEERSGLR
ncbi:MAG: SRPBCC family protein [Actinomycetota bacterium]